MKDFLRVHKTSILCGPQKVFLRGVNLGGWLMMEGYILHAPNVAEQLLKKDFVKTLGVKALRDFEKSFRDNFIREEDFKNIVRLGFNCIRLPFNSRLIERAPFEYDRQGLAYLDTAVRWAQKHGLWVILDLHAGCGAQNHDWHSDSLGEADLWKKKDLQERTISLWEFLADHFKDSPAIAGYDLLNESVLDDVKLLNRFYRLVIEAIRRKDKNHTLFVEGNRWGMDISCLEPFDDANLALSIHFYHPLEFTFNFVPHISYPIESSAGIFDRQSITKLLEPYAKFAREWQRPIYVGEFGVNARQGLYGEHKYLNDVLGCFAKNEFHWTYWTYKAVKNDVFPDGMYSFCENPAWVNRQGPKKGWETYAQHWPKCRGEIISSWRTDRFSEQRPIVETLRKAVSHHA